MSYIKDSHGSVIRTADASGNAMQEAEYRADYDAFGNCYKGVRNTPFGYCGEYVDSESGNVYLRNRYYNSSTGRFITEDPAQDGLNWYVYAGNNPVSFVDPWGLAFTLPGYDPDGDERLQAIQALTDDTLDYDTNTGLIVITNQVSDPTRENGTNLVRELIASEIICTVDYTTDNNAYMNPIYDSENNLIGAEILYNPDLNFDILVKTDSGNQWVPETNFIAMGHELVHFYNRIHGNKDNIPVEDGNYVDPYNGYAYKGGTYYVQDENGVWHTIVDKVEELRTTGIVSYRFWVNSKGVNQVDAMIPGKYSENSLRQEQITPMPIRVKY